jgi:hypothetical protein
MLDIHDAHHAASSWKDFFIHIATICIGLLIAIGLEQTVEWLHHKYQLNEVRQELREERDLNLRLLKLNDAMTDEVEAELNEDLAVLRQREAGDKTPLTGKLHYEWNSYAVITGAWQSATQTASLSLMPESELRTYTYRYFVLGGYMETFGTLNPLIEHCGALARSTGSADLNAEDTRELIQLTIQALGQLTLTRKYGFFASRYGLSDKVDYSFLDQPPPKLY